MNGASVFGLCICILFAAAIVGVAIESDSRNNEAPKPQPHVEITDKSEAYEIVCIHGYKFVSGTLTSYFNHLAGPIGECDED